MPQNAQAVRSKTSPTRVYTLSPRRRASLEALFQLDGASFERNGVSEKVLYQLRNMIDNEGLTAVAKDLELSEVTVLRVVAGFGHRLRPATVRRLCAYFER